MSLSCCVFAGRVFYISTAYLSIYCNVYLVLAGQEREQTQNRSSEVVNTRETIVETTPADPCGGVPTSQYNAGSTGTGMTGSTGMTGTRGATTGAGYSSTSGTGVGSGTTTGSGYGSSSGTTGQGTGTGGRTIT